MQALSLAQSRKQKILADVKRKRRQRTIATLSVIGVLIAIIIAAVFLIHVPPNAVPLPDYLSHCVTGAQVYHSHPSVTITINGQGSLLPTTFNSGCGQPIHTHDSTGVLHVETDQSRDYTLGDWFLLWGNYANSAQTAIFNSTQIFNFKTDATHNLTMTVNGQNSTAFQNYVLLRNAQTGNNPCTPAPCVADSIVITYGP